MIVLRQHQGTTVQHVIKMPANTPLNSSTLQSALPSTLTTSVTPSQHLHRPPASAGQTSVSNTPRTILKPVTRPSAVGSEVSMATSAGVSAPVTHTSGQQESAFSILSGLGQSTAVQQPASSPAKFIYLETQGGRLKIPLRPASNAAASTAPRPAASRMPTPAAGTSLLKRNLLAGAMAQSHGAAETQVQQVLIPQGETSVTVPVEELQQPVVEQEIVEEQQTSIVYQ